MNIFTFASNHPLLTTALIVALLLALSGLGVKDLRQANTALRNRTLELAAQ